MDYLNISVICAIVAIILECVPKLIDKNNKRKIYYSLFVVVFVILSTLSNCKHSTEQDIQSNTLEKKIDTLNAKADSCNMYNNKLQTKISLLGDNILDMKNAIIKANYYYDSANTRLVPMVKSQFFLPGATFHGPVMQGDHNTQNN